MTSLSYITCNWVNLVPGFHVDQLLGFGGEEQLGNALAVPKYAEINQ